MDKQTINIGTVANDGTGDPIRTAFDKINDNLEITGYINLPFSNGSPFSANTVAKSNDASKLCVMNGANLYYTIPSNSVTSFANGSVLTVVNLNATDLKINIAADSMYLAGTTDSNNRTLSQNGLASALKVSDNPTVWIIGGSGLS